MSVIGFQESPDLVLVMPYYSLGSLEGRTDITEAQYVSAFGQILLGLRHLHERNVVHRDLKPANLLVADPFIIVIADFGLSKDATDHLLTTFCGTHLYAAPEVYPGHSDGYGPLVDIWSTGVIMLELMYSRPAEPSMNGITLPAWNKRWSKILVRAVEEWDTDEDKVIDILIHMVRIEPEERLSAEECLERGCDSGLFLRDRHGHIIDSFLVPKRPLSESEANPPAPASTHGCSASTKEDFKDPTPTPYVQRTSMVEET